VGDGLVCRLDEKTDGDDFRCAGDCVDWRRDGDEWFGDDERPLSPVGVQCERAGDTSGVRSPLSHLILGKLQCESSELAEWEWRLSLEVRGLLPKGEP
jgi:hypothetical protein